MRALVYLELYGKLLTREEAENLDLNWLEDLALAQADIELEVAK